MHGPPQDSLSVRRRGLRFDITLCVHWRSLQCVVHSRSCPLAALNTACTTTAHHSHHRCKTRCRLATSWASSTCSCSYARWVLVRLRSCCVARWRRCSCAYVAVQAGCWYA